MGSIYLSAHVRNGSYCIACAPIIVIGSTGALIGATCTFEELIFNWLHDSPAKRCCFVNIYTFHSFSGSLNTQQIHYLKGICIHCTD